MPIQRTYKQSDLEKRLKLLKYQLYGKKDKQPSAISLQSTTESYSVSDLTYLKHDLTKIALLASAAIGVQFILYFSNLLDRVKLF